MCLLFVDSIFYIRLKVEWFVCVHLNFAAIIEVSVFFHVFSMGLVADHQGLPMTRFGQSFGKEITVVNLCTNW